MPHAAPHTSPPHFHPTLQVPFRLTRMMVKAMEVSGIEGNFRTTCENVMRVLRANKESVTAMLEAFVHDPLINWRLLNTAEAAGEVGAAAGVCEGWRGGGQSRMAAGLRPPYHRAHTHAFALLYMHRPVYMHRWELLNPHQAWCSKPCSPHRLSSHAPLAPCAQVGVARPGHDGIGGAPMDTLAPYHYPFPPFLCVHK